MKPVQESLSGQVTLIVQKLIAWTRILQR